MARSRRGAHGELSTFWVFFLNDGPVLLVHKVSVELLQGV